MKRVPTTTEIFGETKTLSAWSKIENISLNVICLRYSRGKRGEDLIKPPVERKSVGIRQRINPDIPLTEELMTHKGRTMSLKEWSLITGIPQNKIMQRYKVGKTPAQVLFVTPNLPTHINQPKNNPCTQMLVTYNNETRNLTQWSKLLSIPYTTILNRYKRHIEGHMTIEEILLGSYKRKRNSTTYTDSYFEPHPYIKHLQTALIASKLLPPIPAPILVQKPKQVIQPTQEQIQDANELRQQLQSLLKDKPKKTIGVRKMTIIPEPLELTAEERIKANALTTQLYRNSSWSKIEDIPAPFKKLIETYVKY